MKRRGFLITVTGATVAAAARGQDQPGVPTKASAQVPWNIPVPGQGTELTAGYVSLEFEGREDPLTAIPKSLAMLRSAFGA